MFQPHSLQEAPLPTPAAVTSGRRGAGGGPVRRGGAGRPAGAAAGAGLLLRGRRRHRRALRPRPRPQHAQGPHQEADVSTTSLYCTSNIL